MTAKEKPEKDPVQVRAEVNAGDWPFGTTEGQMRETIYRSRVHQADKQLASARKKRDPKNPA